MINLTTYIVYIQMSSETHRFILQLHLLYFFTHFTLKYIYIFSSFTCFVSFVCILSLRSLNFFFSATERCFSQGCIKERHNVFPLWTDLHRSYHLIWNYQYYFKYNITICFRIINAWTGIKQVQAAQSEFCYYCSVTALMVRDQAVCGINN